jgi:XTP/dITP diphosphohydrolase
MRLVFASNNAHKLEEVRRIMPEGVEVVSLHEIGFEQEIEETGETLEENSRIKAATVAAFIGERLKVRGERIDGVFADDTGLEITALGGQPGVYSARWAGSPEANRAKALRELADKEDRSARFRTVISLILPSAADAQPTVMQVEGEVRGYITDQEYGKGGFGYDTVFVPEGYDKTFGELPAEVKNQISHRARAMQELVKILPGL